MLQTSSDTQVSLESRLSVWIYVHPSVCLFVCPSQFNVPTCSSRWHVRVFRRTLIPVHCIYKLPVTNLQTNTKLPNDLNGYVALIIQMKLNTCTYKNGMISWTKKKEKNINETTTTKNPTHTQCPERGNLGSQGEGQGHNVVNSDIIWISMLHMNTVPCVDKGGLQLADRRIDARTDLKRYVPQTFRAQGHNEFFGRLNGIWKSKIDACILE